MQSNSGLLARGAALAGTVLISLLFFYSIYRWITLVPSIGGVDLYFYLVTARDVLRDFSSAPIARYGYFPGVYLFWGSVIGLAGESISAIQWTVFTLLVTNAVLIGFIVWIVSRTIAPGIFAAVFYLVFAIRLEGAMGTTEPISTIPFLIGLYFFAILASPGRILGAAALLGVGLGLAAFSKQQGVLLAAGLAGILFSPRAFEFSKPERLTACIVALGAMATTLLLAFVADGGGIGAMKTGLLFAGSYVQRGSFLENISWLNLIQPFPILIVLFAAAWLAANFSERIRNVFRGDEWLLASVALFALAGTFLQYQRRSYHHYTLLGLPQLAILAAFALLFIVRSKGLVQICALLIAVVGRYGPETMF